MNMVTHRNLNSQVFSAGYVYILAAYMNLDINIARNSKSLKLYHQQYIKCIENKKRFKMCK